MILIIKILEKILRNKDVSLNEFLNIKDIPKGKNYLITQDGNVILFIKVSPINVDLLSDDELTSKMDLMSIEFANEQYPYKIVVIPRAVDISEHIHEQQVLKNNCENEIDKKIVENRIIFTSNLVANKDIIENEFYILIWTKNTEDAEIEINKRANNWVSRLRNCEIKSEILKEKDIIFLAKSFTIPEFARKEGTDYRDNIVQIKEKERNC